jgi:hypothetical protein
MVPGEITWTESYNLASDEERAIFINSDPRRFRRNEGPGEYRFGANVKVVKDFKGVYLDLTALASDDLALALGRSRHLEEEIDDEDEGRYTAVVGVLFPELGEEVGLDPDRLRAFNQEQAEKRQQFADYYQAMYGETYNFAVNEKLRQDDLPHEEPVRSWPREGIVRVMRYFGLSM